MERFPRPSVLASASLSEVLDAWSGLGYNRRALYLFNSAHIIAKTMDDEVPSSEEALRSLPGIGIYTARAIRAFAFDLPSIFLETNIRTVYIRHFFQNDLLNDRAMHDLERVSDKALMNIGKALLEEDSGSVLPGLGAGPRLWYSALMDYGAWIKQTEGNFSRKAAGYRVQTAFRGSDRELRGAILKTILAKRMISIDELTHSIHTDQGRLRRCLAALEAEGFLVSETLPQAECGQYYHISLK